MYVHARVCARVRVCERACVRAGGRARPQVNHRRVIPLKMVRILLRRNRQLFRDCVAVCHYVLDRHTVVCCGACLVMSVLVGTRMRFRPGFLVDDHGLHLLA